MLNGGDQIPFFFLHIDVHQLYPEQTESDPPEGILKYLFDVFSLNFRILVGYL